MDVIKAILQRATDISQHSAEWHAARKHTIGGSSIGTLLGVGFNNIQQFLAERILPPTPRTQQQKDEAEVAMNWGTVFEDILAEYVEKRYACKLYGTNSFFIGSGKTSGISYSPDGIAYMDVEYSAVETEIETPEGYKIERVPLIRKEVCLVEFKCPYSRPLRGFMPDYYRPQVLMGLDFLGLSRGIFIEGAFRPCHISQYDDSVLHAKEYCSRKFSQVLAKGVLAIRGDGPMIDLGQRPDLIAYVLGKMIRGDYDRLEEIPTSGYSYCLCWKLFDIGKFQVDPVDNYLEPILPRVRKVLDFITSAAIPQDIKNEDLPAVIEKTRAAIEEFRF